MFVLRPFQQYFSNHKLEQLSCLDKYCSYLKISDVIIFSGVLSEIFMMEIPTLQPI